MMSCVIWWRVVIYIGCKCNLNMTWLQIVDNSYTKDLGILLDKTSVVRNESGVKVPTTSTHPRDLEIDCKYSLSTQQCSNAM